MNLRRIVTAGVAFTLVAAGHVAMAAGSGTKGVAPSAEAAKPLKAGKSVPKVKVKTPEGKSVSLAKALDGEAAAIVFYRGHWCPFCMKHLKSLQKISGQLAEQGVKLIAITPDKPSVVAETLEKGEFSMQILSDGKLDAAKAMGVAFQLDQKTADRYRKTLKENTGHDTGLLPVPSVFLIGKDKKVKYVFSNPDYKVRLSNEELLEAVKKNLTS
jgi:peroxiredoxin